MLFDTGRYFIKNADNGNLATLTDANQSSNVVGSVPLLDDNLRGEKWNIVLLSSRKFNKYKIQNYDYASYASSDTNPDKDYDVLGKSAPRQWTIQGSKIEGRYLISPTTNTELFWGLDDDEHGTPVTLKAGATQPRNQWTFVRISDLDDCIKGMQSDSQSRRLHSLNDLPGHASTTQNLQETIKSGGFATLIDLLDDSDSIVRECASSTLTSLALNVVPLIIVDLYDGKPAVTQTKALNVIVDFAVAREVHEVVVKWEVVVLLVALLRSSDETVQTGATEALRVVTVFEPAQQQARDADAVPELEKVMAENHNARAAAIGTLKHIAEDGYSVPDPIVEVEPAENAPSANTLSPPPTDIFRPTTPQSPPPIDAPPSPSPNAQRFLSQQRLENTRDPILALVEIVSTSSDVTAQIEAMKVLWTMTSRGGEAARISAVNAGAIPALIRMLGASSTRVQHNAGGALANILLYRPSAEEALKENIIPALITVLEGENIPARTQSARAMWELTFNKATMEVAAPAVPSLVRLLGAGDLTAATKAAGALGNVVSHSPSRKAAVDHGAVPLLVHLLESADSQARLRAAGVLHTLLKDNKVAKESLFAAGGIPSLVKMVRDGKDRDCQRQATKALWESLLNFPPSKQACVETNAVQALLEVIRGGNIGAHPAATGALGNLAAYRPSRDILKNSEGALSALLHMLDPESERSVRGSAAKAFREFSVHSGYEQLAFEAGAVPPLIHFLEDADPAACLDAVGAIANILTYKPARVTAFESDALTPLIDLLDSTDRRDVQIQACRALANLITHTPAREAAFDKGALPALAALIKARDQSGPGAELRGRASRTLWELSVCKRAVAAAVLDADLAKAVVEILQFGDESACRNAAGLLANLVNHGPGKAFAMSAGVIPILLKVLERGGADAEVARALWNLGVNNVDLKSAIVEAGAIPLLAKVIATATTSYTKLKAAGAMKSLMALSPAKAVAKGCNVVPALESLLSKLQDEQDVDAMKQVQECLKLLA